MGVCFKTSRLLFLSAVLASCSGQASTSNTTSSQNTEQSLDQNAIILVKEASYPGTKDVFWQIWNFQSSYDRPQLLAVEWLRRYAGVDGFEPGSAYKMTFDDEIEFPMLFVPAAYPWGWTPYPGHIVSFVEIGKGSTVSAEYIDGKIIDSNGKQMKSPNELGSGWPRVVYNASTGEEVKINSLPSGTKLNVTVSSYLPNCPLHLTLAQ